MKNNIPVKIGDQIELVVEAMASSGDGIARHDGYTIFLPSGILLDRVKAEISKTTPRFANAKIIEIIQSSSFRATPPCPVFPHCGGCRFQDLNYEQQMEFKVKTVSDALRRIGGIEPSIEIKPFPADNPWSYRNRARFSISKSKGKINLGFLSRGSHQIVDSHQCGILIDPINEIKEWLRTILQENDISIFDSRRRKGFLGGLVIHHSESTGESIIGFLTTRGHFSKTVKAAICNPQMLEKFGIVGAIQTISPRKTTITPNGENRVLWGQSYLKEKLNDVTWKLSLGSFFQVNPKQTIKLYDLVRNWACQDLNNLVVDAFCGNGGISLWLAKAGLHVLGIEESKLAVNDARESAKLSEFQNCQFLAGKAEDHLTNLQTDKPIGTIIVDPPRQGCSPKVVQSIIDIAPKQIIYVSCNPATLARDLAKLNSYQIQDICVVDMFPQTQHVETAVLLSKV
jgi:23S rRNA (uracil1939-C5)-methyltransferase